MKALIVIFLSIFGLTKSESSWTCENRASIYTIPHRSDCSKFVTCTGGKGTVVECPKRMSYDKNLLACRSTKLAECYRDVPEYIKIACNNLPKSAIIPSLSCERYYECNNKNPIGFECKNGQHFSRTDRTCMNPIRAGCKPLESMCASKTNGFGFAAPNCRDYYHCSNDLHPVLRTCAPGLYFSANNQKCEKEKLSGCIPERRYPIRVCDVSFTKCTYMFISCR